MQPVILFRETLAEEGELAVAKKYFHVIHQRSHAKEDELVIGRYSVLPYYEELTSDLHFRGARLINTNAGHRYIANLEDWYEDLGPELTPRTWFNGPSELPDDGRAFVLKGRTNSRKDRWRTLMFAANKREAIEIYCKLMDDCLIAPQGVVIREYRPLMSFPIENLAGSPVTKEYRFFVYDGKVIAGGYYWSNFLEELRTYEDSPFYPSAADVPVGVLQVFIDCIRKPVDGGPSFYVIDMGQLKTGGWIVIELNDGQMSGLSDVNPDLLYHGLAEALK